MNTIEGLKLTNIESMWIQGFEMSTIDKYALQYPYMMFIPLNEWFMDRTKLIVKESEKLQTTGVKCVNMFKLYLWLTF